MVAIKGIWVLGKGWEESALLFNTLLLYLERNLETSFLISGILNSSILLSCYVKKRSLSISLWDDCFAGRVSLYNYEIRNKLGISEPLNSLCFAWSVFENVLLSVSFSWVMHKTSSCKESCNTEVCKVKTFPFPQLYLPVLLLSLR